MFPYTTILLTGLLVLVTAVPVSQVHPVDVSLSHEPRHNFTLFGRAVGAAFTLSGDLVTASDADKNAAKTSASNLLDAAQETLALPSGLAVALTNNFHTSDDPIEHVTMKFTAAACKGQCTGHGYKIAGNLGKIFSADPSDTPKGKFNQIFPVLTQAQLEAQEKQRQAGVEANSSEDAVAAAKKAKAEKVANAAAADQARKATIAAEKKAAGLKKAAAAKAAGSKG